MMMNESEKGVVYKITNTKNDKVYVGCTTKSIEKRISDQISKANNGHFGKLYEAIATYGPESFKWEQIDTAKSNEELAQKEKEYILKYNSKECGYNSDRGGGIKKRVYSYGPHGYYYVSYPTLKDAEKDLGLPKKAISKICTSATNKYNGGFLSYEYHDNFVSNDKRKKRVYQYSMDGIYLGFHDSVSEASRNTGINKSSISKACRCERVSAGSYMWTYFHYGDNLKNVKLIFERNLFKLEKNKIKFVRTLKNPEEIYEIING